VLDEFQRFRTVSADGSELKVERYMDVWTLLSDGRLPPSHSFLRDLEMAMADAEYAQTKVVRRGLFASGEVDATPAKPAREFPFQLSPYEAQELKTCIKLKESPVEIMGWNSEEIQQKMTTFRDRPTGWETDYSKLLAFVCGNLDEMYRETANRIADCDTDADIFHEITCRMSLIDVKRALGHRFKPEQIARLGNNHVAYPSFNRATFEKLIAVTCDGYLRDIAQLSTLKFLLAQSFTDAVYANAVFPSLGTRPLFSSIHTLLSAPLIHFTLWALEHGASAGDEVLITTEPGQQQLVAQWRELACRQTVTFALHGLKQRQDRDFKVLLAVHEAGHALVYTTLFGQPPREVKIHLASEPGGYNSYLPLLAKSARNVLDLVCGHLAGRADECLVFGKEASTTVGENDLQMATSLVASYVRHFGFGERLARTDVSAEPEDNVNTDIEQSNGQMECLLKAQYARANGVLLE